MFLRSLHSRRLDAAVSAGETEASSWGLWCMPLSAPATTLYGPTADRIVKSWCCDRRSAVSTLGEVEAHRQADRWEDIRNDIRDRQRSLGDDFEFGADARAWSELSGPASNPDRMGQSRRRRPCHSEGCSEPSSQPTLSCIVETLEILSGDVCPWAVAHRDHVRCHGSRLGAGWWAPQPAPRSYRRRPVASGARWPTPRRWIGRGA